MRNVVAVVALISCGAAGAFAQSGSAPLDANGHPKLTATLNDPTPRWADGHPNLGSTAEKKGYWEIRPGGGGGNRAADIPFQPWARALYQYRTKRFSQDSPLLTCKASGGPSFFNSPGFEILDIPEQKSIFILDMAGPHSWRVIYMDGRPHPKDLRPTFLGHSVGHWEGDTLVIDTVGFNEKQWLTGAYPTTEKLHLTERIARPTLGTFSYEATIDDPGAYTKPWTTRFAINEKTPSSWIPNGEMFEYICEDDAR